MAASVRHAVSQNDMAHAPRLAARLRSGSAMSRGMRACVVYTEMRLNQP